MLLTKKVTIHFQENRGFPYGVYPCQVGTRYRPDVISYNDLQLAAAEVYSILEHYI